jgi:hypothetical protein
MKLYEVTAEVTVFVMAEDEEAAWDEGQQALEEEIRNNGCEPNMVREVTAKNWALPADWDRNYLVYGTDTDTTLGSVLDTLPESAKR